MPTSEAPNKPRKFMAEINQEPATKLKAKSLRMAGRAMWTFPTCVAARMPAKMARNTMNQAVPLGSSATAACWPDDDKLASVGPAIFSPAGATAPVASPGEGEFDGFFKVGFPGLF